MPSNPLALADLETRKRGGGAATDREQLTESAVASLQAALTLLSGADA